MYFRDRIILVLGSNFTEVCSWCPIKNTTSLVQAMDWRLSSRYVNQWWLTSLPYKCVTREIKKIWFPVTRSLIYILSESDFPAVSGMAFLINSIVNHGLYTGCLSSMMQFWGQMTHNCVGKLTIIGSDNGLLPGRRPSRYLSKCWNIVN